MRSLLLTIERVEAALAATMGLFRTHSCLSTALAPCRRLPPQNLTHL